MSSRITDVISAETNGWSVRVSRIGVWMLRATARKQIGTMTLGVDFIVHEGRDYDFGPGGVDTFDGTLSFRAGRGSGCTPNDTRSARRAVAKVISANSDWKGN